MMYKQHGMFLVYIHKATQWRLLLPVINFLDKKACAMESDAVFNNFIFRCFTKAATYSCYAFCDTAYRVVKFFSLKSTSEPAMSAERIAELTNVDYWLCIHKDERVAQSEALKNARKREKVARMEHAAHFVDSHMENVELQQVNEDFQRMLRANASALPAGINPSDLSLRPISDLDGKSVLMNPKMRQKILGEGLPDFVPTHTSSSSSSGGHTANIPVLQATSGSSAGFVQESASKAPVEPVQVERSSADNASEKPGLAPTASRITRIGNTRYYSFTSPDGEYSYYLSEPKPLSKTASESSSTAPQKDASSVYIDTLTAKKIEAERDPVRDEEYIQTLKEAILQMEKLREMNASVSTVD